MRPFITPTARVTLPPLVCVEDMAQAIITGDKAQASALLGQGLGDTCPGPRAHVLKQQPARNCSCAGPASGEGAGLWFRNALAINLPLDTPEPKPCLSYPIGSEPVPAGL